MNTQKIAQQIKNTLTGFDEQKIHQLMLMHYKFFRLMDDEGKWELPVFHAFANDLLAPVSEQTAKAFVDEMAQVAELNPYVLNFLKRATNEHFELLSKKAADEGAAVFPELVTYAIALERLTIAFRYNPELILPCIAHFKSLREQKGNFHYRSYFHKVKLLSVERPFHDNAQYRLQTGSIAPDTSRRALPINITEACVFDFINGNKHNAKAGWSLAVNRPGRKKDDPRTGAGPARWSADKKAVCLHMPLAKEWADLYQTWNMAFVVQFPFYPFLLTKLLIPQVARYQSRPNEYIHNRVIALYLTLNYGGFSYEIKQKNGEPERDWRDKKLTALWGESNREAARHYKATLAEKMKG